MRCTNALLKMRVRTKTFYFDVDLYFVLRFTFTRKSLHFSLEKWGFWTPKWSFVIAPLVKVMLWIFYLDHMTSNSLAILKWPRNKYGLAKYDYLPPPVTFSIPGCLRCNRQLCPEKWLEGKTLASEPACRLNRQWQDVLTP